MEDSQTWVPCFWPNLGAGSMPHVPSLLHCIASNRNPPVPKRRRSSSPAQLPALRTRGPRAFSGLTTRSALAFLLLFGVPLLLVYLGTGDSVDMMELFNLVPVREAVRDHHWLMPTLNGFPRLEKPPLPVWVPAYFATLTQSESLWVLRFPSLLMGLLTAVSVYWIGIIVTPSKSDGRKFGLLAACITLSMFVFLRHARLASYDIYSTAFLTLGMVGLLGITDSTKHQNAYTLLAGLGIGLSILSKGPVPVATVCLPFGLYMLFFRRRPAPFIRLAVAALISIAVFFPWLIAIGHYYAEYHPWQVWYREILQNSTAISNNPVQDPADLKKPIFYYLQFFGWVAPHSPVFVAALIAPFLKKNSAAPPALPSAPERRARWAFWFIVIGGLIFISCLAEKKNRYAMPLFPFAGLLCAGIWLDFARLAKESRIDLAAQILLLVQALFFIVPPIALIAAMIWSNVGTLPHWAGGPALAQMLHSFPPALSFILLALTLAAAVYLSRLLFQRDFTTALALLGITSWLLIFTVQCLYRADPSTHTNPARHAAEEASASAGIDLIFTTPQYRPWLSTLYYANRQLPELPLPTLAAVANHAPDSSFFLMLVTGNNQDGPDPNPDAEKIIASFETATRRQPDSITSWFDEHRHTNLYRFAPAASATVPATTTAPAR